MMYPRIRDLREDADLSQAAVAQLLRCTQQTYSNYERGRNHIPPEILADIADIYHTSVDYILGRTDQRTPYPPARH